MFSFFIFTEYFTAFLGKLLNDEATVNLIFLNEIQKKLHLEGSVQGKAFLSILKPSNSGLPNKIDIRGKKFFELFVRGIQISEAQHEGEN